MIPYEELMALPALESAQQYFERDTILYALGVGAGLEEDSSASLPFLYEESLLAVPTMAVVLASPGFWLKDPRYQIDWRRVLHGEQSVRIFHPLQARGRVNSVLTIEEVYDKGGDKGAILHSKRELYDEDTGDHLATERRASFLRGDGGCGGLKSSAPKPPTVPDDRPADYTVTARTGFNQAAIYRLSGDYNPLHIDPAVAASANFERPILHGLCTYGIAGRMLLATLCGNQPERFKRMDLRFSSPVFPGETIVTEIWKAGRGQAVFRARVRERELVVLNNGWFEYD